MIPNGYRKWWYLTFPNCCSHLCLHSSSPRQWYGLTLICRLAHTSSLCDHRQHVGVQCFELCRSLTVAECQLSPQARILTDPQRQYEETSRTLGFPRTQWWHQAIREYLTCLRWYQTFLDHYTCLLPLPN